MKPNQIKPKPYKPEKNQPKQTKLDLTKYLKGFDMSKSAAQLLYAPVLVLGIDPIYRVYNILSVDPLYNISSPATQKSGCPQQCFVQL